MNLENVRYLLTALDAGSFSSAAARLNLTPSGLNRQISALEKDLGTVLLLRNRRGVLPAPGTERILARLREAVVAEDRVKEEITAAKGLLTGHLSIGSYYSMAANFLPPLLKAFSNTYPAIQLSVTEGADSELIEALQAGTLDCAFLSQHSFDGDFLPLFDTEFVAWLPTDHPLSVKSSFRAEDLAEVSPIQTPTFRPALLQHPTLRSTDFPPSRLPIARLRPHTLRKPRFNRFPPEVVSGR